MMNFFTFNCVDSAKNRLTIFCGCKRNNRAFTMHTHTINCIKTLYNISIQFAFRKGALLYYSEKIKSLLPSGGVEN